MHFAHRPQKFMIFLHSLHVIASVPVLNKCQIPHLYVALLSFLFTLASMGAIFSI